MGKELKTSPTNHPSDVNDAEWEFCVPYLTLVEEQAPQREHCLRGVFNALRYLVKTGCPWRDLPSDFLPQYTVYQQTKRWVAAGVFEAMVHDLCKLVRILEGTDAAPSGMVIDGRTLQSAPENGTRAGLKWSRKRGQGKLVHFGC